LKKKSDDWFDSILLRAVDEALSIFGEDTRSAFYEYFRKALNIPKHRIPAKIEEFSNGLYDLLGTGAKIIEISIMTNLHSEVGVVWELDLPDQRIVPDISFVEYVRYAKKYLEEDNNYKDQIGVFVEEKKARLIYK
jgi:hypothetical protein